jgi:hypothetical protein
MDVGASAESQAKHDLASRDPLYQKLLEIAQHRIDMSLTGR